jgi:hypothetical protein
VYSLARATAIQRPGITAQLCPNPRLGHLIVFSLSVLLAWGTSLSRAQVRGQMSPLATGLGKEFASESATVNGITFHYVRGGKGPGVILIHGFPQDWFEYHVIMPRLAKRFTVIAVDLRGVGGSTAMQGGYDAANMAEDVHQLAAALKLERAYIVGHDIGGMVAYAFVRISSGNQALTRCAFVGTIATDEPMLARDPCRMTAITWRSTPPLAEHSLPGITQLPICGSRLRAARLKFTMTGCGVAQVDLACGTNRVARKMGCEGSSTMRGSRS